MGAPPRYLCGHDLQMPFPGTGAYYGTTVEDEALAALTRAADLGVTFWDTADLYGTSRSSVISAPLSLCLQGATGEKTLGKWFAKTGRRSEIFLATKSGSKDFTPGVTVHKFNSKPSHMRRQIENSLKDLQTDYIDLYYQHRVDHDVPIESEYYLGARFPSSDLAISRAGDSPSIRGEGHYSLHRAVRV